MIDLMIKPLKTLKNINHLFLFGLVLFLGSGCASTQKKDQNLEHDAASNIDRSVQKEWDNHTFTASAEYHFSLAQAYSHEGRVDRSIEEYQAALVYDPNSAVLNAKLAAEHLKKGSISLAIEFCKKAVELDAEFIDARLMLGGIYSMNNEIENALAEYDAVLKIDDRNDEAAVFKTQVLVEKNQTGEALKFIRKFVSKVKDSAAAWFYAAKLEQSENHLNEAISDYRKALDLRPGFAQATIALGLIFESHAENQKALELYQDQLEQRQDLQVAGRLAVLYLKLNKLDLAQKTLQVMAVLDPEDLNTQLKLGLVHMQKQELPKAKEVFLSVLSKVPDSDKVHYYLSAVYEESAEFPNAIEHLLKISVDSKLFEDANIHAAELYQRLLQKDKVYATLEDAVKKSPENAGFYLALASLNEEEHQYKKAAENLKQGLKYFPDHEKMHYFYGAMLDKLGKSDESIAEMETLLQQNPNHADALNFVAYTWTSQGVHLKDAEEMLKRAIKLKPESPFILDSLGWNQFMLGNAKQAMIYLEKAVTIKGDEQAILEHLVEVYARNQLPERARATQARIERLAENQSSKAVSSRAPAAVSSAVEQKEPFGHA